MKTLEQFKSEFLANNPAVAGPLELFGLAGGALTDALDDMINKAYAEHITEKTTEPKAAE